MLAAIVRGKDRAWFYKLTATAEQADEVKGAVFHYFESIEIDEQSGEPTAEVPDEWTDRGPSGMRHTTLIVPSGGGEIELSVTALSSAPDWEGLILSNLNRWRGQMKLPPITASELADHTTPLEAAPAGSLAMDIAGWFAGDGMRAPFAGGAAPREMRTPMPRAPKPRNSSRRLTYEIPEAWAELPATSMRLANLRTADNAEVTAFAFAAAGAMGDPLANVNRWRGQVGLGPTTQADLDEASEQITIDGVDGDYIELTGDQGGMIAAMATRGPEVWFFKLSGDPDTAEEHRDAFKAWIDSVRFDPKASPAGENVGDASTNETPSTEANDSE